MKQPDNKETWKLLELCERAIDGRLTESESRELEQRLASDEQARQLFARSLHQHAELRYDQGFMKNLSESVVIKAPTLFQRIRPFTLAAAACVAVGVAGYLLAIGTAVAPQTSQTIATVTKTANSKWAGSTQPTAEGSRIAAGTLELLEGMATLKFDSGAEVVMEAPVTLEMIDAMNCRLIRGTLVADVPPQAIGFTVDTPEAKVVDYGTKFGVSTNENGKYLVKVLEGLVEVNPKNAEQGKFKTRQLSGGQSLDTGLRTSQLNPVSSEQESHRWQPNVILESKDGWQIVSTAYGKGKDSYIQSLEKTKDFGRDPFFRVKHSDLVPNLDRKGYLGFDISRFDQETIQDAELVLSIEPSDLGFASLVPDSTFIVYGVIDENQDNWTETSLSWEEAPAHDPTSTELNLPDLRKAVKLGEFHIAQGVSSGTRSIRTKELSEFLRQDTNGMVTFIICRDTTETARDGLVHAFATKESGHNTPPLLRLKTRP